MAVVMVGLMLFALFVFPAYVVWRDNRRRRQALAALRYQYELANRRAEARARQRTKAAP